MACTGCKVKAVGQQQLDAMVRRGEIPSKAERRRAEKSVAGRSKKSAKKRKRSPIVIGKRVV